MSCRFQAHFYPQCLPSAVVSPWHPATSSRCLSRNGAWNLPAIATWRRTFTFAVTRLKPTVPFDPPRLGNSWPCSYCRWANVIGSSCWRGHSSFFHFPQLSSVSHLQMCWQQRQRRQPVACCEYYVSLSTWPRIRCILVYIAHKSSPNLPRLAGQLRQLRKLNSINLGCLRRSCIRDFAVEWAHFLIS